MFLAYLNGKLPILGKILLLNRKEIKKIQNKMLNGVSCKAGCSVIQVMQKSNSNQDESGFKNKCEQQPFKKAKLVHSWPY